jgi:YNFM family putative membrane transporter
VLIGGLALAFVGIVVTLASPLPLVILGVAMLTAGFFGAHSVASGWVSRRARVARAQATGLYLFFFYLGSSVVASLSGLAWSGGGWLGVASVACMLLVVAIAIAVALYRSARDAVA